MEVSTKNTIICRTITWGSFMKIIMIFFGLIFSTTHLLSQSCQVSIDSLKGEYEGDCKKGKAEGKGTAHGIDSYTGHFKNGYPHGQGKYTWKNGSCYEGSWENGLFEGQGTLSRTNNTTDSAIVLTGYWNKGKFVGRNEKPYIVNLLTNNISDVSVRKLNSTKAEITVTVKNITGGASSFTTPVLPKTRLIGIQMIEGRFEQQAIDETSSSITNRYVFRKVTFPFYAILSFETPSTKLQVEKIRLEIFENCDWYIQVSIDN